MKKLFCLFCGFVVVFLAKGQVSGTYQIKGADTVKFLKIGGATNPNATEFVLQNNTDTVPGFLFNIGSGVTKFKRALTKIDANTYLVGVDTLHISSGGGSPGGTDGMVQINYGSAFVGLANFKFDSAKKTIIVGGATNTINSSTLYNFILGTSNTTNNQYAFAIGSGNTINGNYGVAFGIGNTVGSNSFTSGTNNIKTNNNSASIGSGLINTYPDAVVIGQYNDTTAWPGAAAASDLSLIPVFSIGNGVNNSLRSNVFTILHNGSIILSLHNNATIDSTLTVDQNGNLILKKFVAGGGGGGTLDSVGLKMPTGFTVSGSPQTGTGGTINVTTSLTGVVHAGAGAFTGSLIVDADVNNVSWNKITGTPTTITGYGITNAVRTDQTYTNPAFITSLAWSKITGTPTSLSGYGITDPVVLTSGSYANPTWITQLAWSKITGTPTTIAGYGITDNIVNSINGFSGVVIMKNADSIKGLPVDTTIHRNNYVLTFDSTNRKWFLSASGGSGASTFAGLTDVSVTSPASNQIPVYVTGTGKWTNTSVSTSIISEGSNLYFTNTRFDARFATKSTDSLIEGTGNLYFTQARARGSVNGSGVIAYNSSTGIFSLTTGNWLSTTGNVLNVDTTVGKIATQNFVLSKGYLTANQSITFTATGDISGSATNATTLNPSLSVLGIRNNAIPTLSTGNLRWTGTAWFFDPTLYISENWSGDQFVTAFGHVLQVQNGGIKTFNNSSHTSIFLNTTSRSITILDSTSNAQGSLFVTASNYGVYLQQSAVTGHGLHVLGDSIALFDDGANKTYFFSTGVAKFPTHVTGVTESGSDSSTNFATTQWVKQQHFGTGVGSQTLTATQNATNYTIAISGGNSQNINIATTNLSGLYDTASKRYVDSLKLGLIKDTLKVLHTAGSVWTMYTDNTNKILFDKGWKSSARILFSTNPSDSTNTADLAVIGSITPGAYTNINATVDAYGRITLISNGTSGVGATNLSLVRVAAGDSIKSSTGTGVLVDTANGSNSGLLSVYNWIKLQHPLVVINQSASGLSDSIFVANGDTLKAKQLEFTSIDNSITITKNHTLFKNSYDLSASASFKWANAVASSNYTVSTSNATVLPDLTGQANRNVILPGSPVGYQTNLIFSNINFSSFSWNFSGATVKDAGNNTITALANQRTYWIVWDGTNSVYRVIN